MQATAERKVMARGRPKKSERVDGTAKIDKRLIGMAKLVSQFRGVSSAELMSDMLKGPLEKAYLDMVAKLGKPPKD
jgi:hypothetical protein